MQAVQKQHLASVRIVRLREDNRARTLGLLVPFMRAIGRIRPGISLVSVPLGLGGNAKLHDLGDCGFDIVAVRFGIIVKKQGLPARAPAKSTMMSARSPGARTSLRAVGSAGLPSTTVSSSIPPSEPIW